TERVRWRERRPHGPYRAHRQTDPRSQHPVVVQNVVGVRYLRRYPWLCEGELGSDASPSVALSRLAAQLVLRRRNEGFRIPYTGWVGYPIPAQRDVGWPRYVLGSIQNTGSRNRGGI